MGSRGIHAAVAAVAVTAGLAVVSAAGAEEAANADIYAIGDAVNNCFTEDPAATACATGETGEATIKTGETVMFHFSGTAQHDAVGPSPVPWRVPPSGYGQPGEMYPHTFTQPGVYAFSCSLHPNMTGTITVEGAAATPTPTPSPIPQPSEHVTPPPAGGGGDTVKPTLSSVRAKALRRALRVRFRLSEPATVTVRVKRRGSRRVVKSARVQLRPGTRSVTLRKLKKGRYTVELTARDAFGNASTVARKRFAL